MPSLGRPHPQCLEGIVVDQCVLGRQLGVIACQHPRLQVSSVQLVLGLTEPAGVGRHLGQVPVLDACGEKLVARCITRGLWAVMRVCKREDPIPREQQLQSGRQG